MNEYCKKRMEMYRSEIQKQQKIIIALFVVCVVAVIMLSVNIRRCSYAEAELQERIEMSEHYKDECLKAYDKLKELEK